MGPITEAEGEEKDERKRQKERDVRLDQSWYHKLCFETAILKNRLQRAKMDHTKFQKFDLQISGFVEIR